MKRCFNYCCSDPRKKKKTVVPLLWGDENTVCISEVAVRGCCLCEVSSVKMVQGGTSPASVQAGSSNGRFLSSQ